MRGKGFTVDRIPAFKSGDSGDRIDPEDVHNLTPRQWIAIFRHCELTRGRRLGGEDGLSDESPGSRHVQLPRNVDFSPVFAASQVTEDTQYELVVGTIGEYKGCICMVGQLKDNCNFTHIKGDAW